MENWKLRSFQKTIKLVGLLSVMVGLFGCEDIVETDLEDVAVNLVLPLDSDQISVVPLELRWEEVEGATGYELQIARPNFAEPQSYVLDTQVVLSKTQVTLAEGLYQWRVRALNFSSESEYSYRTFLIDSTSTFFTPVTLLMPLDSSYLNIRDVSLKWESLASAIYYELTVEKVLSGGQLEIVLDKKQTTELTYSLSLDEGKYRWTVVATNSQLQKSLNDTFVFQIDTTTPKASVPFLPALGDTLTGNEVLFKWNRTEDTGSPIFDSLFISDNQDTIHFYGYECTGTELGLTGLQQGKYRWFVSSFDLAGNRQSVPDTLHFYIAP